MNLKLTDNHDLDFSTGNLQLISGSEEVRQMLKVRFQTFQGEWFLDTRIGVPWFQTIYVKGTSDILINSKLRKVVLNCPGITSLNSWSVTKDSTNRTWSISFVALLDSGETLNYLEDFLI